MLFISSKRVAELLGWHKNSLSVIYTALKPNLPYVVPPHEGRGQAARHYEVSHLLAFLSDAMGELSDAKRRAIIDAARPL